MPPPIVSPASCTTTSSPARASVIAAASPFGPEPTTTARLPAKNLAHARDAHAVRALLGFRAVVRRVRCDDQVRRDGTHRRRLGRQDVESGATEPAVAE